MYPTLREEMHKILSRYIESESRVSDATNEIMSMIDREHQHRNPDAIRFKIREIAKRRGFVHD